MNDATLVLVIGLTWFSIGLVLSWIMARRGHLGSGWFVLGVLMGPMAIVFAWDAIRHEDLDVTLVNPGVAHSNATDVLIGIDGSRESRAAVERAVRLFRPSLGRLTLAFVIDRDELPHSERERDAVAELEMQAARVRTLEPPLELLCGTRYTPEELILRGSPAAALRGAAVAGGFDVLVVGHRGTGLSPRVLGSVAQSLAAHCPVPVLVVSPAGQRSNDAKPTATSARTR